MVRTTRGRALALVFALVSFAATSWVVVSGTSRETAPSVGRAVGPRPPATVVTTSSHCVQSPGHESLTVAERLDRAMASALLRGVLRGTVGAPRARTLPDTRNAPGGPVADYPFVPIAYAGKGEPPPYALGRRMTLRVPTDRQDCGGRPVIAAGDEVYAVVREQGGMAGGHTATILVVTSATDVYTVRSGRVVGYGVFSGFSEPIPAFEAHFRGK